MWLSLALAADLPPRPSPESACQGVAPLGFRDQTLVYVLYGPGGAWDGGICLVGLLAEPMCAHGYEKLAYDEAWATWSGALSAATLQPVSADCLSASAQGPLRRIALSESVWLFGLHDRASVLGPHSSGAEGWSPRGQLLVVSRGSQPRRFAVLHGYGTDVFEIDPTLWARAEGAPAICGPHSEPSLIETARTEVRVRTAPSPDATASGTLTPGAWWTGDRSCAHHTVSVDGAPTEGAWLQIVFDPRSDGTWSLGWIHESLVSPRDSPMFP